MNRVAVALALLAAACGSNDKTPAASFRLTASAGAVAGAAVNVQVAALDVSGGIDKSFTGTVHFTSDDAQATLPADVAFTSADAGQKTVPVTFRTAGDRALTAANAALAAAQGTARIPVTAAAATRIALSGVPDSAAAGTPLAITVTAFDAFNNVASGFSGTVQFASTDARAQLPASFTFTAADKGTRTFAVVLGTAATSSITVSSTGFTAATGNVGVTHGAAAKVTIEGLAAEVPVDTNEVITVTVRDVFGNPVTDYTGTLHFVITDANATAASDVAFTAAMHGTTDLTVQFGTAGDQSIVVADTATASLGGSAAATVKHGSATNYVLSSLPGTALAGEPLTLIITAVDAHGNTVKSYAGSASVTSTDSSDRLPSPGGFSEGTRNVSLAFVTSGAHFATVNEVGGALHVNTGTVNVVAADAVLFVVTGGNATAGAAASSTVTAKDTFGNIAASYAGTVSFSSSDANATLPAAFTFTAGDSGQHTFSITFQRAGAQSVAASDGHASGTGSFSVAAGAGSTCDLIDLPASAGAGAQVGLRVVVKDGFGNVASGYTGAVALGSTDAAAQLGSAATFTATDAGAHAFTIQLRTSGNQTVTATDVAAPTLTCQATSNVVPGAAVLAVAFAAPDAWAGTAVNATVTAQDAFANRISGYAGTVAFASSDAAAVKPANVTFAAGDAGQKTVSVTFNSIGIQTFTATDTAAAATTGTGSQSVHGLVYTNPASGGRVRLIASALSSASVVQLDLVSNTSLFPLTAGTNDTVRNGAFAAGMNLPVDATKVGADATPIVTTAPAGSSAVLSLGAAPQAVAAALTSGVLYSGISQKRVDTTAGAASNNMRGDVAVRPFPGAASFYYSVRFRLTPGATAGTVFDGQSLGSKFRAAVRDRSGTDVFSGTADFAIGRLEVK